jgi:hypothetical protein
LTGTFGERLVELPPVRAGEQGAVVELGLVNEDVRVGVRGDGEVPLPNLLADPRPRDAAGVQE